MSEGEGQRALELRQRAVLALGTAPAAGLAGLLQEVIAASCPLEDKYREVDVTSVLWENMAAMPSDGLVTIGRALNILEKYGRNLLMANKPKFWRAVKFNNPVFKTTVDGIQGGRTILRLYGYTVDQGDGMCFPEDVQDPDHGKVAAVTVEVAMLQLELEQLRKGTHPHPELFSRLLPGGELAPQGGHQQETAERTPSASKADPQQPFQIAAVTAPLEACCAVCSKEEVDIHCRSCHWLLCQDCDALYHRHPSRGGHQRTPLRTREQDTAPPSEATVGRSPILGSWPGLPGMVTPPASEEEDVGPRAARPGLGRRSLSADQQSSRPPAPRADRRASDLVALTLPRPPWACASCGLVNEARSVLCGACERPRASPAPVPAAGEARAGALPRGSWCCRACTFRNEPSAVLCSTCERPRLAGRPSFGPAMVDRPSFGPAMVDRPSFGPAMADRPSFDLAMADRPSFGLAMADRPSFGPGTADRPSFGLRKPDSSVLEQTLAPTPAAALQVTGWECQHCTFFNQHPGRICVVCDRTSSRAVGQELSALLGSASSHAKVLKLEEGAGPAPGGGGGAAAAIADRTRQEENRAAGLRLVHMIRLGEEQQRSPEEMFCALRCSGKEAPLAWLQAELPQVLDSIADLARQEGQTAAENQVGTVTRGEARGAWLDCGGDFEEAVRECVRTRTRKFREIRAMGFADQQEVLQALYMNGGDVDKAVIDLQRQLLEPFHTQIWQETEATIRLDQLDRQRVLRQILATYNLPSWGRAEIVLSLMQEGRDHYQISDVVEAVKESQDKEFIKRMLSLTCLVCLSLFPRSKMQSVTSCECTICRDCFKEYFTFTVREKHIKNLVCPGCSKPDLDDEGQLLGYFSTLDVQLRDCLDNDVYNLFHKKLTERTLMKDPKFKWCTHCSNGFIYDGNQIKVTCPQCKGSFCVNCKRPWEPQHQGISCEDFQNWKRENDPEYQAQGLAAYLKENGIDCPNCKFRYSLAKGGCMHFTCSQCQHEFCSGCYNTFLGKKKCTDPACRLKETLHAHHPRDCLSYLRDWPVNRLQALLQSKNVIFDMEPPTGAEPTPGGRCRVMEQREVGDNLTDAPCGAEAREGHAGLCESHYKEYLVSRINGHSLDPAQLFDEEEMQLQLVRNGKAPPPKAAGEDEGQYRNRLLQLICSIPLGEKIPRVRK